MAPKIERNGKGYKVVLETWHMATLLVLIIFTTTINVMHWVEKWTILSRVSSIEQDVNTKFTNRIETIEVKLDKLAENTIDTKHMISDFLINQAKRDLEKGKE